MKNLQDIKNLAKDQILDIKALANVKGGISEPPPFGVEA